MYREGCLMSITHRVFIGDESLPDILMEMFNLQIDNIIIDAYDKLKANTGTSHEPERKDKP